MQAPFSVIITMEAGSCGRIVSLLETARIDTFSYPCIATKYIPFDIDSIIGGTAISNFRIYAFTSRRGVIGALPAKELIGNGSSDIACVGEATAEAARELLGVQCTIMPIENHTGKALADEIADANPEPVSVLHFRGDKVADGLRSGLEEMGWKVCELIVYENLTPDIVPLETLNYAAAAFASPSAAERFFSYNQRMKDNLICAAIGPTTAQKLRELGAKIVHEAPSPTQEELAKTIIGALNLESRIDR